MANNAKLVLQIDVDDKGNPVLKDMDKNMQKATKSASRLGETLKQAGASLALWKAITALQDAVGFVAKEVLDFNKIMLQTQAITGTLPEDIERMKDMVIDLGNATEFTAAEVASATLQLSKMGITVEQQMSFLPDLINFATSSVIELEQAIDIAAQTTKAFQIPMEDLGQVANIIQTAVSSAALNVDDFGESMKFIAPIAKTAGVSLQDTASSIAVLADVGIKGSLAGTSLKNIITNLLQPTEKMADALEKFGLNGKPLPVILKGLKDAGLDVNDFLEGFNLRALAGALALRDVTERSEKLRGELVDQKKTVEDVSKIIRTAWIVQLQQVQSVLTNTAIEFSRVFEDVTDGGALDEFKQFFIDLQKEIRENRDEIRAFVQDAINDLVGALRWIADHREQILFVFKFFIAQKMADIFVNIGKSIFGVASAMTTLNQQGRLIPATMAGIQASLGPLITTVWALNEALTFMADEWERASENKVKAESDLGTPAVETRLSALESIRPFLKTVEDLTHDFNALDKELVQVTHDIDNIDEFSQEASQSFGTNFESEIAELLNIAKEDLSREILRQTQITGLTKEFLEANKTVKSLDLVIKGLNIQLGKNKTAIEEEEKARKKLPATIEGTGFTAKPEKTKEKLEDVSIIFFDQIAKDISNIGLPDKIAENIAGSFENIQVVIPEEGFSGMDNALVNTANAMNTFAESLVRQTSEQFPRLTQILRDNINVFDDLQSRIQAATIGPSGGFGGVPFEPFPNIVFDEAIMEGNEALKELQQEMLITDAEFEKFMINFDEKILKATEEFKDQRIDDLKNLSDSILSMTQLVADGIQSIMEVSLQNEMAALDKRQTELDKRKQAELEKARGNKRQTILIERKFAKEEEQLAKDRAEKAQELRRKQKAFSITQAIINTALAVTNALATVQPYPLAIAASIAAGAAGAAQVAAISAQNFRDGGMVGGLGNSTSDSIPAMLSAGEMVIPAHQVSALGGQRGVQQSLADDVDFVEGMSSTGKSVTVVIDTFIGTEEFKRELFLDLEKESPRWLSGV